MTGGDSHGTRTDRGATSAASTLEVRLREWLAEERRQATEALDAAASYHGVDVEAEVDMRRSHARHRAIGDRIEKVLHGR